MCVGDDVSTRCVRCFIIYSMSLFYFFLDWRIRHEVIQTGSGRDSTKHFMRTVAEINRNI